MSSDHVPYEISFVKKGRKGSAVVTIKIDGKIFDVVHADLTSPKQRAEIVDRVCGEFPGIEREGFEQELLKAADTLLTPGSPKAARTTNGKNPACSGADEPPLKEIDTSAIIRPERFIVREASGLTVPVAVDREGRPEGCWQQYIRWNDGRRECRPLDGYIALSDERRLITHPVPPPPPINLPCPWSYKARQDWLAGKAAVGPSDLFARLCQQIARYIDLPRECAPGVLATITLWTMLTYNYMAWDAIPYLYLGGPLGSGKSRVFEILARLVFRPLLSSNMSAPALFRTLHMQGGTVLLDEAERLRQSQSPEMQEQLSMLLAGYKRGGQATRLEAVNDTFRTVSFDVFGPKALACITGLPAPLASRCIPITMFRSPPSSQTPRRRIDADPAAWQLLRDDLHAFALDCGHEMIELATQVEVCPEMGGRDFELWQPILALAHMIEMNGANGLLGLMQRHALTSIDSAKDDKTPEVDEMLLQALAELVVDRYPTPAEILQHVQDSDYVQFRTWSPSGVARRLKSYGLTTTKSDARREYRITTDQLLPVQRNYSIDLGLEPDPLTTAA